MSHGKLSPVIVETYVPFSTALALACSAQMSLAVDRNSLTGGFRFCWGYQLRSRTLFLPCSFPTGCALHVLHVESSCSCDVGLCLLRTRHPVTTFGAGHIGCG